MITDLKILLTFIGFVKDGLVWVNYWIILDKDIDSSQLI
jgi:hypothetical protein